MKNQKLLISVFDSQEAREAIIGGARVIDCEDPAGALGDIKPVAVMEIAHAVIGCKRSLNVQISTNIGENQMLYKRDDLGHAIQRYDFEIAGKASQAALGVASAMGTDIHPVNIVKVGLDGMPRDIALETLKEVVITLKSSQYFRTSEVIGVFFAQDLEKWEERKANPIVIRDLVLLREYIVDPVNGDIDLNTVFDYDPKTKATALAAIEETCKGDKDLFDADGRFKKIRLTELFDPSSLGYPPVEGERYEMSYIYSAADLCAEAGADGVMIDTRIHTKVAYICCLKTNVEGDINPESNLQRSGIFTLDEFKNYALYCHQMGIEFWASGSIQPYQAQDVWSLNDGEAKGLVDGMAVRSGASGIPRVVARPNATTGQIDNRGSRKIYRDLVNKYAPPEN